MIDFRSDTVTKPTPSMLIAMHQAPVGDDVFGEDPSINALEHAAATMFGYEAALYCSSGTMTNQIAIKIHTQPGDEVICDKTSHIYQYEGGGIAFNSGCSVRLIDGELGLINASDVLQNIHPDDIHKPITRLVSLENTANRGGGSCYAFDEILKIKAVCETHGLQLHLDGARLFNALVAKGETPKQYGEVFDSISICLSKGLGAPVGSVLLGNAAFIKKARRIRKVLGGGMRQAGSIAAAGLYALEHHIDRLAIDHQHAQEIAAVLSKMPFVGNMLPVETNIIIFEIQGSYTATSFVQKMDMMGIKMFTVSPTHVRMVLHLDITEAMVQTTIQAIQSL